MLLLVRAHGASGCSFLVTCGVQLTAERLERANKYNRLRGPDNTTHLRVGKVDFVHNLLWLMGTPTLQPFVQRGRDDSGDVVALFNGEIYNYQQLDTCAAGVDSRNFASDGYTLLPMYRAYGETFTRHFKGEYAVLVADFARDLLILSTDVFGTKPFWYGTKPGRRTDAATAFGIASYESALELLDFENRVELNPNTIEVRCLSTGALLRAHQLHTFSLHQHKQTLDDWNRAFRIALERRIPRQHGLFLGLSSGVDSGLIALRLAEVGHPHHILSISGEENTSVIEARHAYAQRQSRGAGIVHPMVRLSREEYDDEFDWAAQHIEEYQYQSSRSGHRIKLLQDPGVIGLSLICRRAKELGMRAYLSGGGGDEVYGNYRMIQKWPEDLRQIFPWKSFFFNEMRDYLRKEELVAGAHGLEGRYPLLDVNLVQEYLWLAPWLKGRGDKWPLREYMREAGYPVMDKKVGFATHEWKTWGLARFRSMKGRERRWFTRKSSRRHPRFEYNHTEPERRLSALSPPPSEVSASEVPPSLPLTTRGVFRGLIPSASGHAESIRPQPGM